MHFQRSAVLAALLTAIVVVGCAGDPAGDPMPTLAAPKDGRALYVAATGSPGSGNSCEHPYRIASGSNTADEIQETINQAASVGATTVHICAGTYTLEHHLEVSGPLRIAGDGSASTTLDGNDAVTLIVSAARLVITDIALQRGVSEELASVGDGLETFMSGGAVTAGSLTTRSVAFIDNNGSGCGGAVSLLSNVIPLFSGATLFDLSPRGREIYFQNTGSTFIDTAFSGNRAEIAGGAIGGLSLDVSDVPVEGASIAFILEMFLCGAPPITVAGSSFENNEALVGGAIYSIDSRTAMEIGKSFGLPDDAAAARPLTLRRMKELYAMPNLVIDDSDFVNNRSVGRNVFGLEMLPGIGGGAVFDSGVAQVTRSVFSGNGSPLVPANEYDVSVSGGAIAACGYSGRSNTYDDNRAVVGGALAIGLIPMEYFYSLCSADALTEPSTMARLDRFRSDSFQGNVAEEIGGAIIAQSRGRFSGASGLRLSGNGENGSYSIGFFAPSCTARDAVQLRSSWERSGRFFEGAAGEVECFDGSPSPLSANSPAGPLLSLSNRRFDPADTPAYASLFTHAKQAIERFFGH